MSMKGYDEQSTELLTVLSLSLLIVFRLSLLQNLAISSVLDTLLSILPEPTLEQHRVGIGSIYMDSSGKGIFVKKKRKKI